METEMIDGQLYEVDRGRSLITGEMAITYRPLDDDEVVAVQNEKKDNSGVPILNTPDDNIQKKATIHHNNQGVPILNAPMFRDKAVRNVPQVADNIPVLNCPGDLKKVG